MGPVGLTAAMIPWCALLTARLPDVQHRLSTTLPLVAAEDVRSVVLSPDGAWVAYWVGRPEFTSTLFSVRSDGSTAPVELVQVSGLTPPALEFTADGTQIFYRTGETLFSVPSDGSLPPHDWLGPHVSSYRLSPDSARVCIVADAFSDGTLRAAQRAHRPRPGAARAQRSARGGR